MSDHPCIALFLKKKFLKIFFILAKASCLGSRNTVYWTISHKRSWKNYSQNPMLFSYWVLSCSWEWVFCLLNMLKSRGMTEDWLWYQHSWCAFLFHVHSSSIAWTLCRTPFLKIQLWNVPLGVTAIESLCSSIDIRVFILWMSYEAKLLVRLMVPRRKTTSQNICAMCHCLLITWHL